MDNKKIIDLVKIALFPALMVATLWVTIPLPGDVAPITLQTLFVLVAGLYLGVKNATISMELYVLLGAIGLPVFAYYEGGFGVLMGPSGGYIISFIVAAFVVGALKDIVVELTLMRAITISIIGTIIIYLIGIPWMMISLRTSFYETLLMNLPHLPGDIVKILIASIVSVKLFEYEM